MPSPLDRSRGLVADFAAARARAELAIARGAADSDSDRRAVARARRALGAGEAKDWIESAAKMGLFAPDEHGAMLAVVARAARDEVSSRAEVEQGARADEVVIVEGSPRTLHELAIESLEENDPRARIAALAAIGQAWERDRARRAEARAEADTIVSRVRARGPRAPDDAPDDLPARAASFLDATEDAALEALERAAHVHGVREVRTVLDVARALRAPSLDVLAPPRDRGRRIAELLAPIGLDAPLASRATLESAHPFFDLEARAIAIDPPHHARIAASSLELGLASELAMARAVGRVLGTMLVSPALPIVLRMGSSGSIAQGLGELLAVLHADPVFLKRARELDGAGLEAMRWTAAAQTLGRARVLAARAIVDAGSGGERERRERGADLLARALGVRDPSMPASIANPVSLDREHADAALRAAMLAPSILAALRDRYDEDWFRNPRSAEPIRSACSRGLGLAIETWVIELRPSVPAPSPPPPAPPRA